jgi:hypothetical protein
VEEEDEVGVLALVVELAEAVDPRDGHDLQFVARCRLFRQLASHGVLRPDKEHGGGIHGA